MHMDFLTLVKVCKSLFKQYYVESTQKKRLWFKTKIKYVEDEIIAID